MSDQVSKFELQRQQFVTGLEAVATTLRSCAKFADDFAKVVADTPYSPDTAALLQGASESGKGKRKAAQSPEEGEAPKKRRRMPKDPNAPKRPASSYILFQNDVRKELKGQHPNLSNSDLLGLISEQWKGMSQEQKETYNQMMKDAKAQYSEDKKAYDIRNQAESEVADAAKAPEKEGIKPRVSLKPASSRSAPGTSTLPPRLKASGASPSSDSTEDEESEGERPAQVATKKREDSDLSKDEDLPEPKNRRTGSIQPKAKKQSK